MSGGDANFVRGTDPLQGLRAARRAAAEGLVGMYLAESAPPCDHFDLTSQLGARAITDVLAAMVEHSHLGTR